MTEKTVEVVKRVSEKECLFGQAIFINDNEFRGCGGIKIGLWEAHKDSVVVERVEVGQEVRERPINAMLCARTGSWPEFKEYEPGSEYFLGSIN